MSSGSGRHRRRRSHHKSHGARKSPRSSRKPPATQSFNPAPLPSSRTIRFPGTKRQKPVFKAFLAAFVGVVFLILLGGGHNPVALGFALMMPGVLVFFKPPQHGLGKFGDWAAVGFLASLLFAFLPQFYWPDPDWRMEAAESFGMALPGVLSVQPWVSAEAWLMALAGLTWFYAAIQLRVNFAGRRWLFFFISLLVGLLAAIIVWGNIAGARYPGAEDANSFSFFPNRNQTANFLALGGVVSFAYAMAGLRYRVVMPLIGLPCSLLCLAGLVLGVSRAGVLLYFFGIGLWFLVSLRSQSIPRYFKIAFPVVIVALSLVISSNERTVERIVDFSTSEAKFGDEFRLKMYGDASRMVLDAPLTGFGLGSFPAVFPQYREASANHHRVVHPESDFFWLAGEGGLLAVVLFGLFLGAYFWSCRGIGEGPSGTYRALALIAVVIFLIHSFVDVPAHRPGTVYFAILFAALALPRGEDSPASLLGPLLWKFVGGLLFVVGLAWVASGWFGLPAHSSTRLAKYQDSIRTHISVADYERARESVDRWIASRPLDWRAYFQRAQLTLSDEGDRGSAAADFRRARFAEPIIGLVSYEEGHVWLEYDIARAIAAWRETFFREMEQADSNFLRMIRAVRNSPEKLERLGRLSEIDPFYRTLYLRALRGDDFLREIRRELSEDPGLEKFSREQRTDILKIWIERSDLDSAEAFLQDNSASLDRPWWLWSLLRKNEADFEEAVNLIRGSLTPASIPEVKLGDRDLARLTREFAVAPKDIMKGTALLQLYLQNEDYERALAVTERMTEAHKPPLYVDYWRAECLFRLGDSIESWYAFEAYLKKLWKSD